MVRFLLIFIPIVFVAVWWISSIHYITEGKGRKEADMFDSDDGSSFFAAILFLFIIFPFIVRPLMVLRRLYRYIFGELNSKVISDAFKWCIKTFVKTFTMPVKVGRGMLKK